MQRRTLSDDEILRLLFLDESEDEDISSDDDDVADPSVVFNDIDSLAEESEDSGGEKSIHLLFCKA